MVCFGVEPKLYAEPRASVEENTAPTPNQSTRKLVLSANRTNGLVQGRFRYRAEQSRFHSLRSVCGCDGGEGEESRQR